MVHPADLLGQFADPSFVNLSQLAMRYADGIILGDEQIDEEVEKLAKGSGKPLLAFHPRETYIDAYNQFYDEVLEQEPVAVQ